VEKDEKNKVVAPVTYIGAARGEEWRGGAVAEKPELEFLTSLWGLGTEEEEGYRTGPPGYIGWPNSFLGIDSGAPYTFKNTGSAVQVFSSKK
jgi:hypothetical protein